MDDLRKLALELLAKYDGKAESAQPAFDRQLKKHFALRKQLEIEYLDDVAGQRSTATHGRNASTPSSGGQAPSDTLGDDAAAPESGKAHVLADTQDSGDLPGGGGPDEGDTQETAAAASSSRPPNGRTVHVKGSKKFRRKEFWRHPERTEWEKEAARRARLAGSSIWRQLGLKLEKVRFRELDAIIRENGGAAGARIHEGIGNIQLAAFASLIKRHVVPADDSAFVTEVVSEDDLNRFATVAIRQAPDLAARYAKRDAEAIVEDVKLIAAE